ncbi:MAG: hypothetical protein LUC41_01895 [Clostridiales bacterium]|nr:hypothetical protein [Clostridiales bacterium]
MKYPDFVGQYRPKGTIVKRVGDTYYAYYATSKRVPEKKYPVQVIKGLAGKIDQYGFHPLTRAVVDTERVRVRECGFTNFLLKFEDEYISNRKGGSVKDRRDLYRSMIVYLSPESYLCDDSGQTIYSPEEMTKRFHIGIPNQITAISKLCEFDLRELEPLKRISNVRMGERVFASELTQQQKELLDRIGVSEEDVR